jgi:hypothetical protein
VGWKQQCGVLVAPPLPDKLLAERGWARRAPFSAPLEHWRLTGADAAHGGRRRTAEQTPPFAARRWLVWQCRCKSAPKPGRDQANELRLPRASLSIVYLSIDTPLYPSTVTAVECARSVLGNAGAARPAVSVNLPGSAPRLHPLGPVR